MTGLLYQIFNLSGSFEQSTPRILAAWAVGVVLSSGILVVVLAATTHALVYEVSPFGGPVSKVLFQSARVMSVPFDWLMGKVDDIAGWLDCRIASIPFYRILPVVGRVLAWPLWLCSLLVDQWRVKLDQSDRGKLLKAFMDLMSEASDPKLLERAVGSFSYIEWSENGKGAVDQLEKTRNRLMATDTSVRVRETLRARAKQLAPSDSRKLRNMGERLTKELVQFFLGIHSYPRDFGGSLRLFEFEEKFLDTSFGEDNTDLRPLAALPFEECVARVLCSYNHEGKLGDRRSIFDLAEIHCWRLLREGKVDDVTRILSHVDRLDLIKSYIQVPGLIFPSVVKFIVKDDKHEILRKINEFVREIDQSRLGPQSLSKVFSVLASPPPTNLDLSPLIDHFSRHPRYRTWWEISDIITAYLSSFDLPQLSDSTAVRQFLQQCVDTEFRNKYGTRYPTNNKTRARARDLLAGELSSSFPLHSIDRTRRTQSPPFFSHRSDRLYIQPTSVAISLSIQRTDSQQCLSARPSPLPFPSFREYRC
ncbi:hypothetical protein SISSUDRAFT_838077 [Sistotremastrum suecicum HHB10207 ss-3]|uniref:Uncharacterized protein n=1 Tax=Sistotremastrum suecicum HHB10207 ss-3 TaxID=1314776 RepID=A0A166CL50_9AGAM|nr:hypothetical protein SISSUDRAFT_838077 [Sistotremastrum suecicum HHB10207 ss-3]